MEIPIPRAALRRPSSSAAAALKPLLLSSTLISLLLLVFLLSFPFQSHDPTRFSIVIDAGSSGTRLHLFHYALRQDPKNSFPPFDLESTAVMKTSPGLSAYKDDPDGAGESLGELLEFGRRRVPREQWRETEIRLMATAGMRMVENGVKERILEGCRRVLRRSGFLFRDEWAAVIPGSDEGIYAWVTANYALGALGGDPEKTTGIIELGGASAQITFVPNEPFPAEFSRVLKFGIHTYNLFSQSFLHFGQNAAHESLFELLGSRNMKSSSEPSQEGIFIDPCTPKGYSHGLGYVELSAGELSSKMEHYPGARGNFSECRSAALTLLQREKGKCLYQECRLGSNFIPKLQGQFLATENFFYTSKFFGLGPKLSLSDLMLAGEQFCGEDWSWLEKKYHTSNEEDLLQYCFSSAYIVALLHDSLGIALDENRIRFANQVAGVQLNWALGAFIMESISNPSVIQSNWFITVVRDNFLMLLSLLVISALLVFTAWIVSKWRKPHLKTIYDLEKGRYIVTRVSR